MTFENFIPPRSKKVLEVTGEVTQDFQTTEENFLAVQPACKYTVAKNLDDVDGKFDSILLQSNFIGNLNHDALIALIKKSADKLNKRGVLIFALDNIGFAENVMAVLQDKPPKFKITLSRTELEQAITAANLNSYRMMNVGRKMTLPRGLTELAKVDLATFAYVISATPEQLPPRTLLQYAIGENLVCAPIRIHMPNQFFLTEPNIYVTSTLSTQNLKIFSREDFDKKVMINQRISQSSFAEGKKVFETLRDANYLYISEMDDHPVRWENAYGASGNINFVGVHAIQTSTKYLADYFKQFNPHVKVFANHLRRLLPQRNFDEEFQQNKPVTIFFGALNRDEEFKELLPVLNKMAKTYGEKILFKILARPEHFHALETENKILLGDINQFDGQFIPYNQYEDALRTSDIALLPLQDNIFNRAKSDLKFIECGNCGVAALASPVVYSVVVKDGVNGFIYHNLKEFAQKLKLLIENPAKRRELAQNAYDYVKNNRLLSQHYEERLDWYRELLERLPELNKETQQRIEKLSANFQSAGFFNANAEIIIPD